MRDLRGNSDSIRAHVRALRERLASQSRQAHEDLAKATTVPLEALDLGDPMLEAALTDSAMQFFLRHMISLIEQPTEEAPDPDEALRQNDIPEAVVRATRDMLAALEPVPAPELFHVFEDERLWILIDLLIHGDILSQHRATVELREYMSKIRAGEVTASDLRPVVASLRDMAPRPLVLDLLLRCAAERGEDDA